MNKKRKEPPISTLDEYEQEIEDNFGEGKPYPVSKVKTYSRLAKKAADDYIRKNKRVTIRVYEADLERIKRQALEEGLNYQTYITSVLHKLSTGRLRIHD